MTDFINSISSALINSLTAIAILSFAGFLLRSYIVKWLEVRLGEGAQIRISKLEAKLSNEKSEVSDLRQFIFSGKLNRNDALISKQISAAECLWNSLLDNKRHSILVTFLQSIKVDEIDKLVTEDGCKNIADTMAEPTGFSSFLEEASKMSPKEKSASANLAAKHRPFISPLAWALYSASNSITMHAVVTMMAWKNGLGTKLLKNEHLKEVAIKALPHQKNFIDEYGVGGTYFLLEELEERLLEELRRFIREGETNEDLAAQAKDILVQSKNSNAITATAT